MWHDRSVIDPMDVPPDLGGVPVAMTETGDVIGKQGLYHYRGRSAPELARTADFETAAAWMLDASDAPLALVRTIPSAVAEAAASHGVRAGVAAFGEHAGLRPLFDLEPADRRSQAEAVIGALPTIIASACHHRSVEPDASLGHVADYLRMMQGTPGSDEQVAALQTYAVLTIDHGFANSAFATRVVASSGTDLAGCVLAALASLSGPLHGANVERILEMYDEIGSAERADDYLRAEVAARRRVQGFGHAVYETEDPRLALLREVGAQVSPELHALAVAVEEAGRRTLAGRRGIEPNLDLHAGVVLEGCGIPRGWFTATFAVARVVGWCAHALEQAELPKIIRPSAQYVGPPPDEGMN
jgi:citrate synthase